MSKKQSDDKGRTQIKALPKAEETLSKTEQRKVKGGGWIASPAGSAKPTTDR